MNIKNLIELYIQPHTSRPSSPFLHFCFINHSPSILQCTKQPNTSMRFTFLFVGLVPVAIAVAIPYPLPPPLPIPSPSPSSNPPSAPSLPHTEQTGTITMFNGTSKGLIVTGTYTVPFPLLDSGSGSGSANFTFCLADKRLKAFTCPEEKEVNGGARGTGGNAGKDRKFQELIEWIRKWWKKNDGT
ncbi:hypothetical protein BDD12DRAFT_831346 [Trichophaea hybrida]|nr:hypothetical protein BDD12DRAFT_831346 [Trichophaea hybrida]